jgi:hypothetical protein
MRPCTRSRRNCSIPGRKPSNRIRATNP